MIVMQLIEHVFIRESDDVDKALWKREKYWQAQSFILINGLNYMNEWYALDRRSYSKYLPKIISDRFIIYNWNL